MEARNIIKCLRNGKETSLRLYAFTAITGIAVEVGVMRGQTGFWGGSKDLMWTEGEDGYAMMEVCLKECIDGAGSDITLNRQYKRGKFGYAILNGVRLRNINRIGGKQW